ncbi:tyrosine-type recombinase/integrase [Pedobacter immunditicola]|uniref:tyrosine-type recombinase/integrase n=1 Tax=Pedobacter immunditicola TaxID=3133440 RepID=UPI00309B5B37
MEKFTYSAPFMYPDSTNNYKDSKGLEVKKWCVRYTIEFEGGKKEYRKESGANYDIQVNRCKNIDDKIEQFNDVLDGVIEDLTNGIDPKFRQQLLKNKLKIKIQEERKYTLDYVFTKWFEAKNYLNPIPSKVISAEKYQRFFKNQFIPYFKSKGIDQDIRLITDVELNEFINEKYLAGTWSAFTCNNRIGWISGLFKYAFKNKLIAINPIVYVDQIKEDKIIINKDGDLILKKRKEVRFNHFSDDELKLVFSTFSLKYEVISKAILYSFIRFSEIFRLKLEHLDLENRVFNIPAHIAKGQRDGAVAKVRIYPALFTVLNKYIDEFFGDDQKPEYYLFYHLEDKNTPMTYSMFQHFFGMMKDEIFEENEIILNKTPYAFKHTGARKFISNAKKLNKSSYEIKDALMKQMRHSSFAITEKYIYNDLGLVLDDNADDFAF